MNMTFRWYGRDNDTVTLEQVKQIPNVKGIVWALHRKPVGEVWETDEIKSEVEYIKSFGFHADVVESVNIHESIKLGNNERDLFIENYKKPFGTWVNLGLKLFVITSCLSLIGHELTYTAHFQMAQRHYFMKRTKWKNWIRKI